MMAADEFIIQSMGSSPTVEITPDMVDRAAQEYWRQVGIRQKDGSDQYPVELDQDERDAFRAALDAALNGGGA